MAKKIESSATVTRADIERFDKVRVQMQQLATDFADLSKKAPDSPVSKFKLAFINEKLRDANTMLVAPFKPIEAFEEFDDAALPSNSDVVMVLGQYLKCLEQWRSANVHFERLGGYKTRWVWNVRGETITTTASTSVSRKEDD
jgi:hypothetical protein